MGDVMTKKREQHEILLSILFQVGNDFGNIIKIVYVGRYFSHFQPCR
jgi:hypothetical protein